MDGQINQNCHKTGTRKPECTANCHANREESHSGAETAESVENWFQPYLDACNEAKKYKAMYEETLGALKTVCRLI